MVYIIPNTRWFITYPILDGFGGAGDYYYDGDDNDAYGVAVDNGSGGADDDNDDDDGLFNTSNTPHIKSFTDSSE